jgi:hypothetical protein
MAVAWKLVKKKSKHMQYLNFRGTGDGDVDSAVVFNLLRMKATGSSEVLVHIQ